MRGADVAIENSAFVWETSDASVVTVDENGIVKGLKNGKATVKGTVGDFSGEIEVTVEIPTMHSQDVTSNEGWTLEVSNLSNQSVTALADGGIAVDYTTTASRKIYLTIAKDAQSWSRPDSLVIELNPGTSSWKALTINFADYRTPDALVSYEFNPNLTANAMNRISIPMSAIVDLKDMSTYPLVFKNLYVVLSDKNGTTHHVELKKLAWIYNAIPATSAVEQVIVGEKSLILSPNPVDAGSVVKLGVNEAVKYTMCTLNGAVVAQGVGTELPTVGLSAGMYVVKVEGLNSARLLIK